LKIDKLQFKWKYMINQKSEQQKLM